MSAEGLMALRVLAGIGAFLLAMFVLPADLVHTFAMLSVGFWLGRRYGRRV